MNVLCGVPGVVVSVSYGRAEWSMRPLINNLLPLLNSAFLGLNKFSLSVIKESSGVAATAFCLYSPSSVSRRYFTLGVCACVCVCVCV